MNEWDGLQHWGDGSKHDLTDKSVVSGVNLYAEVSKRKAGKRVYTSDVDVETLEEKASRNKEVQEATATLKKH